MNQKQKPVLQALLGARGEDAIIDVAMLGSVGVGKTTLLASMYERFGHVIGSTDLSVLPADQRTSARLQGYINELRRITSTPRALGGLAGTETVREYMFKVGRKGRPPLFDLRFTDYPGKYLLNPDIDSGNKLQRALDRADVIVVAIDTPALMMGHHDFINTPMVINDTIMRMAEREMDRLILLVPLRCERWVSTVEGALQLADRVAQEYRSLLSQLGSATLRNRMACVLTPVQTIGGVVFSRLEEDGSGHPIFHFRIRNADAVYKSVDTDQLLRYTLRFVVNKYRTSEQRGLLRSLWEQVIGTDLALVAAVDEFSGACKSTDGFAVFQDHALLAPGH